MCGITGFWAPGRAGLAVLDGMTAAIAHRGPDDSGTWIDAEAGLAFGHRRLAIIDVSAAGHQPMVSPCERYVLSYNGEIYNHGDIRRELEAAGHIPWAGHSDTETLVAAISRWGLERAVSKCVGMFAFSLWDRKERKLSLVRDRMGEKPLYYGWAAGAFLFGSELKSFASFEGFDPDLDRRAIDQLLRRAYIPAPFSIYRNIFKLLPGSILRIGAEAIAGRPADFDGQPSSSAAVQLTPYWSFGQASEHGRTAPVQTEQEAIDRLEQLLIRSVQQQSIADVPVGTFLSGGYDSSTIAAVQQRHSASKVQTFTIGFDELGFDEAPHARAVATHLGTEHHEMKVSAADALDVIPSLATMYDEPFADSSQIPTHLLSRLARRTVKVALSGDGGDELFGGYNRFVFFERYRRRLGKIPAPVRIGAAALIRAAGTHRIDAFGQLSGMSKRWPQLGLKAQKGAALLSSADHISAVYDTLVAQWDRSAEVVKDVKPQSWPNQEELEGLSDTEQMMLWDATGYLPDDILVKVDRASMAASLETRAPFLDHRLVEFTSRIPVSMKVRGGSGKWVLRQLLYQYVPRELVDRPKAGFAIPLGEWLRGPLRDWAEGLLDPAALRGDGYLNPQPIVDRWRTHLSRARDYSSALWPVLMFQDWLEKQKSGSRMPRQLAAAE